MSLSQETQQVVQTAATAAIDKGATDLVALDVTERFPFAEAFLIVTGEVERNVQAISDGIEDTLNESGQRTIRREGREGGRWVLLDFGDVIVHVFHQEEREYYDIERLWRDCPLIELEVNTSGLPGDEEVR